MSFINWLYDFSTATTEPPVATQVRFDAGHPYTAVTKLWARNLNTASSDVHTVLIAVPTGSTLYVQDKNDHALFARFLTTDVAVDKVDYVEFPVAWVANGGALLQQEVQFAILTEAVLPGPGPGIPELVTLAEAKDHLGIDSLDTASDVDIQAKLDAATAIILDYCNTTAYWRDITSTWDSATVPRQVKAAILLELGELSRFRGDDPEAPERWPDHDLSPAIIGLLRRTHDPAVV